MASPELKRAAEERKAQRERLLAAPAPALAGALLVRVLLQDGLLASALFDDLHVRRTLKSPPDGFLRRARHRTLRVLGCPGEDVVRDLLPTVLAGEVAAAPVLLVLGRTRRLALLLEVRVVDGRRADAVLRAGHEEQRRSVRIAVVDLRRGVRIEVGVTGLEKRTRRAGDVVALVDGVRIFSAERVGEAPMELLRRERYPLVQ